MQRKFCEKLQIADFNRRWDGGQSGDIRVLFSHSSEVIFKMT